MFDSDSDYVYIGRTIKIYEHFDGEDSWVEVHEKIGKHFIVIQHDVDIDAAIKSLEKLRKEIDGPMIKGSGKGRAANTIRNRKKSDD